MKVEALGEFHCPDRALQLPEEREQARPRGLGENVVRGDRKRSIHRAGYFTHYSW